MRGMPAVYSGLHAGRIERRVCPNRERGLQVGSCFRAEKAGLKKEDVLIEVDGQTVKTVADARIALWQKKPGDKVIIRVRRDRLFGSPATLPLEVTLAAPEKAIVAH